MDDDMLTALSLLHGSDRRWRTLRAAGEVWVDEDRTREAYLRSIPPGAVVSTRGTPGPADRDPCWSAWVREPDQWRSVYGGSHQTRFEVIADGRRTCSRHPVDGRWRIGEDGAEVGSIAGPAGMLVRPRDLLPPLDHVSVSRATALGRDVLTVTARPRPDAGRRGPRVFMGADEVELGIDAERGVLLWLEERLDGEAYRRVAMTSVAFDEELDDSLFMFPDDAVDAGTHRLGRPPHRPPPSSRRTGPPDGVLGAPVGAGVIVARTETFVIAVDGIVAYPTGFELGVTVRTHPGAVASGSGRVPLRSWSGSAAFPSESLLVRVTAAADLRSTPLYGAGSQTRFDQWFWVEPLPPAGPLGVVVEWPSRDLPEARADLDAGAIIDAASRAETLWS